MKPLPLSLATLLSIAQVYSHAEPSAPAPPNAALLALEKQVLYHPRKYDATVIRKFLERGGKRLDYKTGGEAQTAWIIPATKSDVPGKLWVMCGGNGTLALELENLCRHLDFSQDTFLLVDYPGYGECKGEPSPAGIHDNLKSAILLTSKQLNIEPAQLPARVCMFGHSLGCAAALLAVSEFNLKSVVLCAPFTSTMEMARDKFNVPVDFPFQHKFDNRTGLNVLSKNGGHAWIFHGDADGVIPVAMSRTLAKEYKDTVKLNVVPSGNHVDIFTRAATELLQAMTDARK